MILIKFQLRKLGRDRIEETLEKKGIAAIVRKIEGEELLMAFRQKILEEAIEVTEAQSKDDIIAELGDLVDVLECFMEKCAISKEQVDCVRAEKQRVLGTFRNGLYFDAFLVPNNSPYLQEYIDRPHKFRRIHEEEPTKE